MNTAAMASTPSNSSSLRATTNVVAVEAFIIPAFLSVGCSTFDLMRAQSLTLLTMQHPAFRALSPETAAVVLRKSQARIRRKRHHTLDR